MRRGVLAAVLLATACAGPRVPVATVAPPAPAAEWRTQLGAIGQIEREWWHAFGDPELVRLVDAALTNSTDIGVAAARVREARAQERNARAQLLPAFDFAAGGARSRGVSAFAQPLVQTSLQPQFVASYEIDAFGRLDDQVDGARAGVRASEAARDAVRLSVASSVASGYIVLRALDARLEIARATLALRAEALRIARSRTDAGYAPALELRQAEAEHAATAQLIPQLELAIARQENALSHLSGDAPHAIARGVAFAALHEPAIPAGLPSELLRRRPDIARAEFQLAASDADLAAARKRFLPQFRLTGSTGLALSTILGDPISLWSLGGSVLAPLFAGGRLEAQAERAAAQRDAAAFNYRGTALNAFREVEDALAAIRRLSEQLQHLRAQRAAFAEGLRLATNRYRAGYATYLEQLDAQRGLLNVELTLVQTRSDEMAARVALYQALGGGWLTKAETAGID